MPVQGDGDQGIFVSVSILKWLIEVGYDQFFDSLHHNKVRTLDDLSRIARTDPEFFETRIGMNPCTSQKFVDIVKINTSAQHQKKPQQHCIEDKNENSVPSGIQDRFVEVGPTVVAEAKRKGLVFTETFTSKTLVLDLMHSHDGRRLPVIRTPPDKSRHVRPGDHLVTVDFEKLVGSNDTNARARKLIQASSQHVVLGFRAPYELSCLLEEFDEVARFDAVVVQMRRNLPYRSGPRFTYRHVVELGEKGLMNSGISESTTKKMYERAKGHCRGPSRTKKVQPLL